MVHVPVEVEKIVHVEVPGPERLVEVEKIVEVEKPVEVIREVEKVVVDNERITTLTTDNKSLKQRIAELEKQLLEKPTVVEKVVEIEKPVDRIIEKAASKDLRDAARLLARSEMNKEDLTEDDIFEALQKSSEDEVKRKLGFWAIPLPGADSEAGPVNKKYTSKRR